MLTKLRAAEAAAKLGKPARIILKMNALTDEALVKALVKAGRAGVEIDLIVRGACILPVDAKGLDGRIRVRSIIGRLLEHSRVFYFKIGDDAFMWLSSADWMNRNMMRRVEIAWPIIDSRHQARILEECCQAYLDDNFDAWLLQSDGSYQFATDTAINKTNLFSAQQYLMQKYTD